MNPEIPIERVKAKPRTVAPDNKVEYFESQRENRLIAGTIRLKGHTKLSGVAIVFLKERGRHIAVATNPAKAQVEIAAWPLLNLVVMQSRFRGVLAIFSLDFLRGY